MRPLERFFPPRRTFVNFNTCVRCTVRLFMFFASFVCVCVFLIIIMSIDFSEYLCLFLNFFHLYDVQTNLFGMRNDVTARMM